MGGGQGPGQNQGFSHKKGGGKPRRNIGAFVGGGAKIGGEFPGWTGRGSRGTLLWEELKGLVLTEGQSGREVRNRLIAVAGNVRGGFARGGLGRGNERASRACITILSWGKKTTRRTPGRPYTDKQGGEGVSRGVLGGGGENKRKGKQKANGPGEGGGVRGKNLGRGVWSILTARQPGLGFCCCGRKPGEQRRQHKKNRGVGGHPQSTGKRTQGYAEKRGTFLGYGGNRGGGGAAKTGRAGAANVGRWLGAAKHVFPNTIGGAGARGG